MKKYMFTIVSIIITLSLSACGKESKHQTDSNTAVKCPQSVYTSSSSDIASGETGYYVLEGLSHDKYLSYISKNNMKETYLCSKPECSHVDDSGLFGVNTCNAYVGNALPKSVVYHNGYVYVLEYDEKTYDVTLVKISADGSVHENVMIVGQSPESASYYDYVFVDDNTVFMVYNAPDSNDESHMVSLDKIDLTKKEKTSVYKYTETGASILNLKVLNNNIFFRQAKRSKDTGIYGLMRYDTKTGQVDTLLEGNIISYTIGDNGQIFYYMAEDALYSLDLETKQSAKLRECDDETMYAALACDGTYLYLDNMLNRFFHNKNSEHQTFVCDLSGNIVNTIPMEVAGIEVSDSDYILTQESSKEGSYWVYIQKSSIKDAKEWRKVG